MPPLEADGAKDVGEPLDLGLLTHRGRSGHDDAAYARRDLSAIDDAGGVTQVLNAGIGAGTDEGVGDRNGVELGAGLQPHVGQRIAGGSAACRIGF